MLLGHYTDFRSNGYMLFRCEKGSRKCSLSPAVAQLSGNYALVEAEEHGVGLIICRTKQRRHFSAKRPILLSSSF